MDSKKTCLSEERWTREMNWSRQISNRNTEETKGLTNRCRPETNGSRREIISFLRREWTEHLTSILGLRMRMELSKMRISTRTSKRMQTPALKTPLLTSPPTNTPTSLTLKPSKQLSKHRTFSTTSAKSLRSSF